jgi:hypothetical protein
MAIQTAQSMDVLRRRFNPDRDMVWALPRIVRRVLDRMAFEPEQLRAELQTCDAASAVFSADTELVDSLSQVVTMLAQYFKLMGSKDATEHAVELFNRIFIEHKAFATVIAVALVRELLLELPFWYEQIRPQSKLDPMPEIEEIDAAVERLLSRARSGN